MTILIRNGIATPSEAGHEPLWSLYQAHRFTPSRIVAHGHANDPVTERLEYIRDPSKNAAVLRETGTEASAALGAHNGIPIFRGLGRTVASEGYVFPDIGVFDPVTAGGITFMLVRRGNAAQIAGSSFSIRKNPSEAALVEFVTNSSSETGVRIRHRYGTDTMRNVQINASAQETNWRGWAVVVNYSAMTVRLFALGIGTTDNTQDIHPHIGEDEEPDPGPPDFSGHTARLLDWRYANASAVARWEGDLALFTHVNEPLSGSAFTDWVQDGIDLTTALRA